MALLYPLYLAMACIAVAIYVCYIKWLRSKYPPGPWPLPIIGNLHLLSKNQHVDLTNLSKKYGPVYTVWLGSTPMVIASDKNGINEVLYKKGMDFAGRPVGTLGLKVLFYDHQDLVFRSYDDKVKIFKKLGMSLMRDKATGAVRLEEIVEEEVEHLITRITNLEEEVVGAHTLIEVPIANTIMRSIFGFRFENEHDPKFKAFINQKERKAAATEKAVMIDVFKPLWYLLPSVRKEIYETTDFCKAHFERIVDEHEETYQEGTIRDFTDAVIKYYREQGESVRPSKRLTKLNIVTFLMNVVGGGTETTNLTIVWAFLSLLHYPDIQCKIYQELNEHCLSKLSKREPNGMSDGKESSKLTFNYRDRCELPYLNAFIHEILRRFTIFPLAAPHSSMVDTSIGQYSIPKNTSVSCNIYAYAMDPTIWPRPTEFLPERFLDEFGKFDTCKARLLFAFGAGARGCIGENLARKEIFICLANILHCFEVCCPADQNLPTLDGFMLGFSYSPMPFNVQFKRRGK